MRTKLIDYLFEKKQKTGGNCGTTIPQLKEELNCELSELKEILNDLFKSGLIEIKHGIHGRMVLYK